MNKQADPESKRRRSIRLEGYDYSQAGGYFITVSTSGRKRLFGNVGRGEMEINELGKIAKDCWDDIPIHFLNVDVDLSVVMPNHVHGILFIRGKDLATVGAHHAAPLPQRGISTNVKPGSLGAIVRSFKSAVSRRAEMEVNIRNVWQRNYYEHIIRDNADYERIGSYILDNPVNWDCDEENI
jgi:putative transposase